MLGCASVVLAGGADLRERIYLLRNWSLFAAAVFAVVLPHLLLPDPDFRLVHLMNAPPRELLRHQLKLLAPLVAVFALPCLVLAFYAPGQAAADLAVKSLHALANLLLVIGVGLYSFQKYVTIGKRSQAWQEGRRGEAWRSLNEHAPAGFAFGVPDGLIPAVTATGHIFLVGVLFVIASALIRPLASDVWVWLPGMALTAWMSGRLAGRMDRFDGDFYCTNAFYGELFRMEGGARVSEARRLPYEALYWVPERWKPHVWISLRQFDRRLPLGRFVALGHLLLWFLVYQEVAPAVTTAYLLIFSAGKNGMVGFLAAPAFAPQPFQVVQQSPGDWTVTRFFVNLRWTLPLFLSLSLIALLDEGYGFGWVMAWSALDVILALAAAGIVTYYREIRYAVR